MDLGIDGKVALVTGASRGIGRATARMLAAEGASVLLVGRSEEALAEAAAECDGRGATFAIDLRDPAAGDAAVEECVRRFGRIDALVNNAGVIHVAPIDELTDADWQAQWEIHVMAPMRLMRAAAPRMAERGWGRIVNVSSSSGKRPSQRNAAYSVTKAAELSLSRTFADAWADKGVAINAVAPGLTGTDMWLGAGGLADQEAARGGSDRDELIASLGARVPRGQIATDEEIAAAIVFLCSERAANVVGAAWSVDGGSVPTIL